MLCWVTSRPDDHQGPGAVRPGPPHRIVVDIGLGMPGVTLPRWPLTPKAPPITTTSFTRALPGAASSASARLVRGPMVWGDLAGMGLHRLDDVLPGQAGIGMRSPPRLDVAKAARAVHHRRRPHGLTCSLARRRPGPRPPSCHILLEPEGVCGCHFFDGGICQTPW